MSATRTETSDLTKEQWMRPNLGLLSRHQHRWLVGLLCLSLSHCGEPTQSLRLAARSATDLPLVHLGARNLRQDFYHLNSVPLGRGWYKPTEENNMAWSAKRSLLYFSPPLDVDIDIDVVLHCIPFHYEGAPQQRLIPIINGRQLPPINLNFELREVRFPLPRAHVTPGINTLELRFAYATQPRDVADSNDNRPLAVLFDYIAFVPRHLSRIAFFENPPRFEPENGHIELPSCEGSVRLPLPAASSVAIRLGMVRSTGDRSLLSLTVISRDGQRERLWQGKPNHASGLVLHTHRSPADPAELLIQLVPKPDTELSGCDSVTLTVDPDFILPEVLPKWPEELAWPPVFIYLIDTLRADALEPYGSPRPTSPRINEFARDAVTFERAWSPSSWTLPATVSVLTGRYPFNHGYRRIGIHNKPDHQVPRLAELLRGRGYETLAISQSFIASDAHGIGAGFDNFYLNDIIDHGGQRTENVRWFLWRHLLHQAQFERPLFCYIHTVAPHAPYVPKDMRFAEQSPGMLDPDLYGPYTFMAEGFGSDPEERAHLRGLYDGEVAYADQQFGAFLDLLRYAGLYDQSLIILTSDHGEEFYEHDGFDHGRTLYEELLHVPLMVKFPDSWQGNRRIRARVSIVDIAPTILDLLEEDPSRLDFDGKSLRATFREKPPQDRRVVFAETSPESQGEWYSEVELMAIVADNIKCINNRMGINRFFKEEPKFQVFDLRVDQAERSPLPLVEDRAAQCVKTLREWAERVAIRPPAKDIGMVSPEEHARLQALGYID